MLPKLVSTVRSYNINMQLGYVVDVLMKALNSCTKAARLRSVQMALQPFMIDINHTMTVRGSGSRGE